jgi:uncharacterized protein (DUF4415 family)
MKRRVISRKSERRKGIDLSDIPQVSPEQFARAIVRRGLKPVRRKAQVTLRIDSEVIEWFRARGRGYQTHINAILKAYRDAHRGSA